MNVYKQVAIDFVSKIPEFKGNYALLDNFLGNLNKVQQNKLIIFLENTGLLFVEETLSGDFSCKTGNYFNLINKSEINTFIEKINNGDYDSYFK